VPTYGYRCPACATEFEVWQKMTDPPGAPCPACGADAKRIFFPAGIVFKGTGFYATDSRKSSTASSSNGSGSGEKSPAGAKPADTSAPAKDSGAASTSPSPPSTSASTPTS